MAERMKQPASTVCVFITTVSNCPGQAAAAAVACQWVAEEQRTLSSLAHLADILRLTARRVSVGSETGFHRHHVGSPCPFRTVTQQMSFGSKSHAQSHVSWSFWTD